MKVYLANGRYFEKQADARAEDRKFETIDFPFGASPKSDFIDWLNDRPATVAVTHTPVAEGFASTNQPVEELPVDRYVQREAERRTSQPVAEPRAPRTADGVVEWMLDDATPAEVENVFTAIGARFHEMRKMAA